MERGDFTPYRVRRVPGADLTKEWACQDGLHEPLLVPRKEGLGLLVPPCTFTVRDVARTIGEESPVNVMDVAKQEELKGWTLGRWADYYEASPLRRAQVHT